MGINIVTNMASLVTQRRLTEASSNLATSYERLSSGMRIVKASDDAAGLAIADKLRVDKRLCTVAMRNANDGISMISIADGALSEISNVLGRMAELAEQSANGVINNGQRSALDTEFSELGKEIQRISQTSEFNGIALLSGGADIVMQVGLNAQSTAQISFSGVRGTLASLGLAKSERGAAINDYTINVGTNKHANWASFQVNAAGSQYFYMMSETDFFHLPSSGIPLSEFGQRYAVTQENYDFWQSSTPSDNVALFENDFTLVSTTYAPGSVGTSLGYSLIGATTADSQAASFSALDAVKGAISSVSSFRGTLGVVESRLSISITNLQVSRENYSAAESEIRDTDVAAESAKLTKNSILQQAGAAILTQANQQPQLALSLLS